MFIRVENDILESAITQAPKAPEVKRLEDGAIDNPVDTSGIRLLEEIAIAIMRGKNYVFIPGWEKYKEKLKSVLSNHTFRIIDGLKRQDGNALERLLRWKVIVTDKHPTSKVGDIMYFSPKTDSSFEVFDEVHLVCENMSDCKFYEVIEKFYRKHLAQGLNRGSICRFLHRNGGGNTIDKIVEKECDSKNHMILAIADSDYKYADLKIMGETRSLGDTAKKLRTLHRKKSYPFYHLYIMEECREVENLIPRKILRAHHPNSGEKSKKFTRLTHLKFLQYQNFLTRRADSRCPNRPSCDAL